MRFLLLLNSLLISLFKKSLKITVVLLLIVVIVLVFPPQAKSYSYPKNNSAHLGLQEAGPAYNFGGGGLDVDEAIQWMINHVRGCYVREKKVDVIVIRDSGSDAYNQPILAMEGVDSVKTLIISGRKDAQQENVVEHIQDAEVIFFAGGDQCQYLRNYRNTGVEEAIKSVIAKGGAVGGTSAGAMIQSNFVFNACSETVTSETALKNPYEDITLSQDFFHWQNLSNTIIDTHFSKRDRMGRLMTFVARLLRDGMSSTILGIGIDENTSLIVDQNGLAKVMGDKFVYFVLGDHLPEECEPQTPLTFSRFKIWKRGNGETFDLSNRVLNDDYYQVSVEKGEIDSNPY
ncbi:MAG: type 1 glutamine amidotransferase-like domain-containing protein [Okeania sp. SIO2F4]|uniref:cyanophycinase n=1 Tax=Okeania sp. SIO2F4 TaxID=2607790 RepID=UPI00142A397B|nr:Type 1 glutamine amidotransferase-like domain-containing protein [Okeania sp. SIO2F4]NES06050.1 type 1 glutamine amidotransferase-like domain-containing protein [Okeania sp. SIO2F4]